MSSSTLASWSLSSALLSDNGFHTTALVTYQIVGIGVGTASPITHQVTGTTALIAYQAILSTVSGTDLVVGLCILVLVTYHFVSTGFGVTFLSSYQVTGYCTTALTANQVFIFHVSAQDFLASAPSSASTFRDAPHMSRGGDAHGPLLG